MAARSRVTRSGRLNPDSESGQVIDVPFHADVVNQSLQTPSNPPVVNQTVQTPVNPPQMTPTRNPGKEKEPQELPMCDIVTMMVKRAKWIARGLRRNIEEVLYLDCEEQRTLILRLLELHNPMRDDLYTDEVIDDRISLSQTPDSSSSSSEDVPSIVGRSG
ncbi:uncharacterized protein LOC113362263 [Papaver somniferum]|uniref:uncharacterized protein LOC113362263 n=1 Tax=Papaver somniferum TaxID=3469 RepID=UPI000E70028A|nr:uncharacterized protein LOC113362263 [Papaver somniferum]